jgi:16S rRNA (adenine1518-N6/adenine1519-N6)-dimethyltransferase
LLESTGVRPNKRLGQHFLIDLNLMRLLVDSADIKKEDVVLEAGCATGSLTEALASRAGRVVAVEFDGNLIEIARRQLEKIENIDFINTDILENKKTISHTVTNALNQALKKHCGRCLLVANLPYNVATLVILNLITGPVIAEKMYVTVQKEVADRMTAAEGSKNYGILSIFVGVTGSVKVIRKLKPAVFWPQPNVDSAMVGFIRDNAKACRIKNMQKFSKIVGFFMGHRRKTLLACSKLAHDRFIKAQNWSEIFEKCSVNPAQRPEQLCPGKYFELAEFAEK